MKPEGEKRADENKAEDVFWCLHSFIYLCFDQGDGFIHDQVAR